MPNNRCIAEQHAISLKSKLKRNSDFHGDYKTFMKTIIENGYTVKMPKEQLSLARCGTFLTTEYTTQRKRRSA